MHAKELTYDLVIVGTGFASSFFLLEYLRTASAEARILVIERGKHDSHSWQLTHRTNSSVDHDASFINKSQKQWIFNIGFGGGSNCWWACTPRFLPNDFKMRTRYGVGQDWPISYEDLEPFYGEAEDLIQISGNSEDSPFPRSSPYPQPPHRFTSVDRALKKLHPTSFFNMPTARFRVGTATQPPCCANGVCGICPLNAKFTISSGLRSTFDDPRVTLLLDSEVTALHRTGSSIDKITFTRDGVSQDAKTSAVALGANAIFNPFLLLRSGIEHPMLGRRLNEQIAQVVDIDLEDIDNFDGSTSITGHSYLDYDGDHRRHRAGSLIETWNVPRIRAEHGKWRKFLSVKLVYEDMPSPDNRVYIDPSDPNRPAVQHLNYSDYALAGLATCQSTVEKLVGGLGVEDIRMKATREPTEAHVLGTVVAGNDPSTSVVDAGLLHHEIRNLWVLGGSAFPTSSPSNPSLTIAALSLHAARKAFA